MARIIHKNPATIKGFWIVAFAIFLIGNMLSFYAGFLYAKQRFLVPKIEIPGFCTASTSTDMVYVSPTSKYYYMPWCNSRIKNKIWLTKKQAQQRGYKKARYCIE